MYLRTIATAAITSLLLIGCSEQSSVNSPVQDASTSNKGVSTRVSSESGLIEVNQTVSDPATGDQYVVTGSIEFQISKSASDYSFAHKAELTVRNSDPMKKYSSSLEEKGAQEGKTEEAVIYVSKEYELASIPGAPMLRLHFSFDDKAVSLDSIELETITRNVDDR